MHENNTDYWYMHNKSRELCVFLDMCMHHTLTTPNIVTKPAFPYSTCAAALAITAASFMFPAYVTVSVFVLAVALIAWEYRIRYMESPAYTISCIRSRMQSLFVAERAPAMAEAIKIIEQYDNSYKYEPETRYKLVVVDRFLCLYETRKEYVSAFETEAIKSRCDTRHDLKRALDE